MATASYTVRRPVPTTGDPVDRLASDVDGHFTVPAPETPQPARSVDPLVPSSRRATDPWYRREALPLMLAVAGWPLWWALGMSQLVFILAAIPLGWRLVSRGNIKFPPGFSLWALFLLTVLISVLALDVVAEGARTPSGVGRYLAFGARFANYAAVTVVLLYIGNASERVLPRAKLVAWLAYLGLTSLLLGVLSLFFPDVEWARPLNLVLPSAFSEGGVNRLAQVQDVIGDPTPRPAAPFAFTNAWGNATALLLVWVLVWTFLGSRGRRFWVALLLLLGLAPIIYSLNRGMWLGLLIALIIVGVRLALRGRTRLMAASAVGLVVVATVVALSPLNTLLTQRFDAGHSNSVRSSLAESAVDLARQSPIIGLGSTRNTIGSEASIAIGPTPSCPRCGGRVIGSTGQFTLLLVAQGFVGLALYVGYFLASLWAFRRDHSVLGIAGWTVVSLGLFLGFFYTALTLPLAVVFCSIGLMWRNAQVRDEAAHG